MDISFTQFNADALDQIQVATPCRADWNAMKGDDRARFCPTCAKNVYNLSGMKRSEAESLVRGMEGEGELCVRFYQRADGTVLTSDCPVGMRGVGMRVARRPLKWMMTTIVMVLAPVLAFGGVVGGTRMRRNAHNSSDGAVAALRSMQPFRMVFDWIDPAPPVVMGEMMIVPQTVTPTLVPPIKPNQSTSNQAKQKTEAAAGLKCEPLQQDTI